MGDHLSASLREFCNAIAKGPYVPGAGSVAALGGAAASALIVAATKVNTKAVGQTACKLSDAEIQSISREAQDHLAALQAAVQEDADKFGLVGAMRDSREEHLRGSDEWRRLNEQSWMLLIQSSPTLVQIAQRSERVADLGCRLATGGVWWVAGDCHVATHLALAAVEGALATLRVNTYTVREFDPGWCDETLTIIKHLEQKINASRTRLSTSPARCYTQERPDPSA